MQNDQKHMLKDFLFFLQNYNCKRTDDLCQYKKYFNDFDTHKRVKQGLILFTSKVLNMNSTDTGCFATHVLDK